MAVIDVSVNEAGILSENVSSIAVLNVSVFDVNFLTENSFIPASPNRNTRVVSFVSIHDVLTDRQNLSDPTGYYDTTPAPPIFYRPRKK